MLRQRSEYSGEWETTGSRPRSRWRTTARRQERRGPFRHTDIEYESLPDQIVERPERLVERHVGIVPMTLVDIDVPGSESPERGVALLDHVLARETAAGRPRSHRKEDLGRDHVLVARNPTQRPPEDPLDGAVHIRVRGVEHIDAEFERLHDAFGGNPILDVVAVCQPRAESDLGDL